jgi:uncharacterized protein (UPF0254 family)
LDVASIASITLILSWCVDGPAIATPVAGYAIKKIAASVARAVRRRTNVDVGFNGTSADAVRPIEQVLKYFRGLSR